MINLLMNQAKIHLESADKISLEVIPKIDLTYKRICEEKKKCMKVIDQEIIKENNQMFENSKKDMKKKIPENIDIESIQLSLDMEFQENYKPSCYWLFFKRNNGFLIEVQYILDHIEGADIEKTKTLVEAIKLLGGYQEK